MKKFNLGKLELIVFLCGAVVMILELIGARLLAPYLGTAIYVWASLIGVILGALSLGYWIGGRLADKHPQYSYLATIILISALYIGLIPLFKDLILGLSVQAGIKIGSVISASLLFIVPSVLLGMVSPYALRLKIKSLKTSGNTAGTLYALSTLGSISGTFLAGFWLIPNFQLTDMLFGLGILLIAVSFLTFPKKILPHTVVLIITLLSFPVYKIGEARQPFLVNQDSAYNHISIYDTHKENRPVRILRLDKDVHSGIYLDDPTELLFEYAKFYRLDDFFNQGKIKRALMLGGGGYSAPRDFLQRHPKAFIDVVEIDPEVTQLAKKYFFLKDSPKLQIFHEDARTYLNQTRKKYDVIYNDAFNSTFSIPYQLTTQEAIEKMYNCLNEDGVLIINIISAVEGKKTAFLKAEYKTIKTVFPSVYLFPILPEDPNSSQNILIVALKQRKFNVQKEIQNNKNKQIDHYLKKHYYDKKIESLSTIPLLTDNYAPVNSLIKEMFVD